MTDDPTLPGEPDHPGRPGPAHDAAEPVLAAGLLAAAERVRATPDLVEIELGARRHRARRRAGLGVAAAMLVAGAAGAGFGLGRSVTSTGDQLTAPASPAAEAADVGADRDEHTEPGAGGDDSAVEVDELPAVPSEPPLPAPAVDADDSGAMATAEAGDLAFDRPEYDMVLERTLESGLTVRVSRGPSYGGGYWEPAEGEWSPEPWCYDESEGRVAVAGAGVIDVGWFSFVNRPEALPSVSPIDVGWIDGRPHRVLVVQFDDATGATVSYADGGTDTTEFVDGVGVLVVPGEHSWDGYEITVSVGAETHVLDQYGGQPYSDPAWLAACTPPPPELPDAGEQPADAAAAEAEIRANFALVYDQTVGRDDKPDHLLDDWTGVAEAQEQVRAGDFADAAASATLVIDELVFTSPTEAWFRYTIDASSGRFSDRFGVARLIDGHWSLVRATVCQDLSLAGGSCADDRYFNVMPGNDQFEFLFEDEIWYEDGVIEGRVAVTTVAPPPEG